MNYNKKVNPLKLHCKTIFFLKKDANNILCKIYCDVKIMQKCVKIRLERIKYTKFNIHYLQVDFLGVQNALTFFRLSTSFRGTLYS